MDPNPPSVPGHTAAPVSFENPFVEVHPTAPAPDGAAPQWGPVLVGGAVSSGASDGAASEGSVDDAAALGVLRDILFGTYAATFERRLEEAEAGLARELEAVRHDIAGLRRRLDEQEGDRSSPRALLEQLAAHLAP